MTANQTIHCSCGEVFSERAIAETHAYLYRGQPDAHTIIEEIPVPHAEAVDIAMAATAGMLRTMDLAPKLEGVARRIAETRLEMMREVAAIETATIALEVAKKRYEVTRGKIEALDREIDDLARAIAFGETAAKPAGFTPTSTRTRIPAHDGSEVKIVIAGAGGRSDRPVSLCSCGCVFRIDDGRSFLRCPVTHEPNPEILKIVGYEP